MFDRRPKSKISRFFKSQGFFLSLIVCVAAVGIAALAIFTAPSEENSINVQKQNAPTLKEQIAAVPTPTLTPTPSPSPSPIPSSTPSVVPQPSAASAAIIKEPTSSVSLVRPLSGDILTDFSGDTLIYHATLNQWETHDGIDIAPKDSSETDILAALSGTVLSVDTDQTKGLIVTLAHNNDQKTVYAGLQEVSVEEGSKVSAGQSIGKVGIPSFEADLGEHVHFEYIRNGKFVNPTSYFRQNK